MSKSITAIITLLLILFVNVGCEKNYNNGTFADFDGYRKVISDDHITLSEALNLLEGDNTGNSDAITLKDFLKSLEKCRGKYYQESEHGGNVYTAEMDFYLSYGDICCEIDYSGYSGVLGDGQIKSLNSGKYKFATYPEGEFIGRTQYFTIEFDEDEMHVMWGGNVGDNLCEYYLKRNDKYSGDVRESFEDSELYDLLCENLEHTFGSIDYRIVYLQSSLELDIYIEAPKGTRDALLTYNESLLESWSEVIEATKNLCDVYLSALKTPGYATCVKLTWVDRLIENNVYTTYNIISMVENGIEKYSMLYS